MTVFDECALLLRHPNGGVEDLAAMKAAGFQGVFCNIGDHPPEAWEYIVRPRALALGMFCGPWARTAGPGNTWAPGKLEQLRRCAERWDSPLVVNCESEIKGSGEEITGQIAEECEGLDAAVSMEAWLFNPPNVVWTPVAHMPMLLQIFPQESAPAADPYGCKEHAHACGIQRVYFTFGTYHEQPPSTYELQAPYSLYTGDDMGGDYQAWRPTSTGYNPAAPAPPKPPSNGGTTMPVVGSAQSCRDAWNNLKASSSLDAWRRDNPGEWGKLQDYWIAAAGTPPPDGIKSKMGLAHLGVIEARRYAEGSHG